MKYFNEIFRIQPIENDLLRQSKLINVLSTLIFTGNLLMGVSFFFYSQVKPDILLDIGKPYVAIIFLFAIMPVVFIVNRKGFTAIAAVLFLISLVIVVYIGDSPSEVLEGRSLIFFTMPILLAPFISHPFASLGMALLVTLSLSAFGIYHNIWPNFVACIFYWLFAFILWVVSSINRQTFLRLKETKENYKSAVMDRIQTEAALRNSEERYRTFVESFKGIVYIKSMSGKPLFFHGAVKELTGYHQDDFLQTPGFWKQLLHPDDLSKWEKIQTQLIQTCNFSTEIQYRHKDKKGIYHWFQEYTQNISYDSGQPAFIQGIIYDISHSKVMEDQLQQTLKMDALGRLAGGVAHDFNNILTSILGYCQIMSFETNLPKSIVENLEEIQKASERAVSLTDQLLSFSRKKNRVVKSFSLADLVFSMKKMVKRLIDENITIYYDIDNKAPNIKADVSQIEQVLLNLTINARDAMPMGGNIIIRTKEIMLDEIFCSKLMGVKSGLYVMLEVADNGHGIDHETLEHIYEPFYSTKKQGSGTGLGLSIVFGIVNQNNGHIFCESQPELGTVFRIYFPACFEAEEIKTDVPKESLPQGNEKILLVEDDDTLRKMIYLVLNHLGYQVVTATQGKEALKKIDSFNSHGIDLLITDVVMPEMDGCQLYKELIRRWPEMKALFISGYRSHLLDDIKMEQGKTSFLPKPFSSHTLATKVRGLLNAVLHV